MDERVKVYEEKMNKSVESLEREYASIRAGRANPHVLDKITVDYYAHRHRSSRSATSQCRKRV